jgi:RNA polymerase sigma-70 factor (ECF subfamily)
MTNRRELVTTARDGDRHAFADPVDLESREAIGPCLAILRNQSDAEDAAQEAFVRAWRQLPSLRNPDLWGGRFRRLTVSAAITLPHFSPAGRIPR